MMKKNITFIFLLICAALLEAAPLIGLKEARMVPSYLEATQKAEITFLLIEKNNIEVLGNNRIKITVAMGKTRVEDSDIEYISIVDLTDERKDVTDKFSVRYLEADNMVIIQQKVNENLSANMRYRISISVIANINIKQSSGNDFLVNMSSEGDAIADGML
ncbi:MAG: Unknown protein [uncultured Sulfurovum sp.]|uniref:Uncharacterized protein n=1 Tax=uncultured Sulfurovum sp. TaxID=269237 RepID=A0A6S6SII0_9BACT|nr:MAG: Unknown protein [uncultured Sulfurovum sp.]